MTRIGGGEGNVDWSQVGGQESEKELADVTHDATDDGADTAGPIGTDGPTPAKQPFFARFLERQFREGQLPEVPGRNEAPGGGDIATMKYPSDEDGGGEEIPGDGDIRTLKFPSDEDGGGEDPLGPPPLGPGDFPLPDGDTMIA
jgi:hypothetical protein